MNSIKNLLNTTRNLCLRITWVHHACYSMHGTVCYLKYFGPPTLTVHDRPVWSAQFRLEHPSRIKKSSILLLVKDAVFGKRFKTRTFHNIWWTKIINWRRFGKSTDKRPVILTTTEASHLENPKLLLVSNIWITKKEVLLNLNRKRIFSAAEEKFRLEQKKLKECYVMAMALDIRLAISEDATVPNIIEKEGFRFGWDVLKFSSREAYLKPNKVESA